MKKMNKKGFTIVELVIVIAVIAILAAVMIPTFSGVVKNAQTAAHLQKARNAYAAYVANVKYEDGETPETKLYVEVEASEGTKAAVYYEVVNGKVSESSVATSANVKIITPDGKVKS